VKSLSVAGKEAEILLLEADAVPGGKMRTIRQDGFSMEWGRTASSNNKPHGMELVKDLGLGDRLARSSDLARKRFILSGGVLHRLPRRAAFFKSRLLSLPGRLRILWEPFAPGPPRTSTSRWGSSHAGGSVRGAGEADRPDGHRDLRGRPGQDVAAVLLPGDPRPGAEVRRARPRMLGVRKSGRNRA